MRHPLTTAQVENLPHASSASLVKERAGLDYGSGPGLTLAQQHRCPPAQAPAPASPVVPEEQEYQMVPPASPVDTPGRSLCENGNVADPGPSPTPALLDRPCRGN